MGQGWVAHAWSVPSTAYPTVDGKRLHLKHARLRMSPNDGGFSHAQFLTAIAAPDTIQISWSPAPVRNEAAEPADEDDAGGSSSSTWRFDPATDAADVWEGWPAAWGGQTMDWADWRAGYASQPDEHCYWLDDVDVTGTIPAALEGTYFRNGPALFEWGGQRLQHPFDGDGLVTALSVSSGRAHFRSRYVETAERAAEQEAGKLLYPCTFGTYTPSRSSPTHKAVVEVCMSPLEPSTMISSFTSQEFVEGAGRSLCVGRINTRWKEAQGAPKRSH